LDLGGVLALPLKHDLPFPSRHTGQDRQHELAGRVARVQSPPARQGRCLVGSTAGGHPHARKNLAVWSKIRDSVGPIIDSESNFMATRPASAKKTPVKKPVVKRPAVAAPKPKAVAAPVVTLKTVFEQLGETHALPKKQAHALLADFVAAVTMHLEQGARIRMSGLGTLEVKTRAERMGRNPATGEQIKIKASKKVAFRAAKELKEAI
jgi:DNA-binding protein HU-beta